MRRTLLIISVVYVSLLAYALAFLGTARVGHLPGLRIALGERRGTR